MLFGTTKKNAFIIKEEKEIEKRFATDKPYPYGY
jgi:hypothetical protein